MPKAEVEFQSKQRNLLMNSWLLGVTTCIIAELFLLTCQAEETRFWYTTNGTRIEAELKRIRKDSVRVRPKGGRNYEIPLSNLSEFDREFVKIQRKARRLKIAPKTATKDAPFVNSLGMKFVPVPGTNILMSIWETRCRDYEEYSKENCQKYLKKTGDRQFGDHPVILMTWEDATGFCRWLSQREGRKYRLPLDYEWSVAVGIGHLEDPEATPSERAHVVGDHLSNVFPWGKEWPPKNNVGNLGGSEVTYFDMGKSPNPNLEMKNYRDSYAFTSPVGAYPANGLGIFDLGGNAREGCKDLLDGTSGATRVIRGGGFLSNLEGENNSDRRFFWHQPMIDIGFRCVLELENGSHKH